ncbi:MAG: Gx transporter family protein [bacterium]
MEKQNFLPLREIIVFSAAACVFQLSEAIIPKPLPFLRIGIANIPAFMLVVTGNLKGALTVSAVRTTASGILLGNFLSPFYFLSLFGAVSSNLVVASVIFLKKELFSIPGLAIIGALSSNITQLLAAYFVLGSQKEVFAFLPLFLLLALPSGGITGGISYYLIPKWQKFRLERSSP